ncbi:MAG: hypothetical protein U9R26_00255 [Campylobacterota bacterium]|nr:hypothetical protein [Campylobacterota bacterium]
MQKVSPSYTLLILSLSSPILLGVYRDGTLIEKIESEKKTSDILLPVITELMDRYPVSSMIYTRGPGSYMAIKLTYIILRTIEIIKNIPFWGCSAFALNGNKPVKAMGNLYFVKEKETIITQKFDQMIPQKFELPSSLATLAIDEVSTPNYVLPAV